MTADPGSPEEYCREIEAYLCRRNEGHLIRIVGPAFEQVCGWAQRGVPLKLAFRGIDRYFERYYAKGPRRRPVRVEFCEADVLDVFDEWRRAIGIPAGAAPPSAHADAAAQDDASEATAAEAGRRHGSLPAHLERVIARLTTLRSGEDRSLDDAMERVIRELDATRAGAKALRGEARQALIDRLRALDRSLLDAARARCDDATLRQIESEAAAELMPFRQRMPGEAYDQAMRACADRILRERTRLPIMTFD